MSRPPATERPAGAPPAGALRCVGCAQPFGSAVPFCPFCGVAQRPVAVPPPRPVTGSVPQTPLPPPLPVAPAPAPVPTPQPEQPLAPPPVVRPRKRAPVWVVLAALAAMGLIAILVSRNASPAASLVVQVRAQNGNLVPAGQVLVDNQAVGAPGETLSVPPGTVTVSYAKPGWRVSPRSVTLAARASATVELAAQELPGHLALTSNPPGATVAFSGRTYGRTPFATDLPAGPYDVSVTLAGYVGKVVSVTVGRGETATINVDLASTPVRRADAPFDRGVMLRGTQLLGQPAGNADVLGILQAGSEVQVQAKVTADVAWLQVRGGGRQGYVPADTVEAWDSWAQRNGVAGPIDAVSPDLRLTIKGGVYALAGVQAPAAGAADLARLDASLLGVLRGVQARCVPRDPASFVCKTPEDRDIAELYLLNGAAVAAAGALPYYAEAQRQAREQRRGVWGP